jgi:hypothetical protein
VKKRKRQRKGSEKRYRAIEDKKGKIYTEKATTKKGTVCEEYKIV